MAGPKLIYFIRHGEKPGEPDPDSVGVTSSGNPDKKSITPVGWERAGALAVLFGPRASAVTTPTVIYAASATTPKASQRPLETVTPVAALLKLDIRSSYDKDDLASMVVDVLGRNEEVVLVGWEHKALAAGLTAANALRARTRNATDIPNNWPDGRFDMIWAFTLQSDSSYVFSWIPQLVLANDVATHWDSTTV